MKLKLIALGAVLPIAANAATNVTLQNFQGTSSGAPIVDNAGVPIDNSLAKWAVGTFALGFAVTLPDLDTLTEDQNVIDNFTQSGTDGALSINGLFNASVSADGADNSLKDEVIFALVTYDAPGGVQALVFNVGTLFPEQDDTGNGSVDIGRILVASDVAFGNRTAVAADPSTLPAPFAGFTSGVTFDAIPEPSTGLLSLIAGLGFLARRRR